MSVSSAQTQFVALLKNLFQIDDLDLDFGIYRVLNQERKVIEKFLDERIQPLTQEALGAADDAGRAALEAELAALTKTLEDAGVAPENAPKWVAKKADLDALGTSSALETEVYNGLTDFFGRYYESGDFLSRPRYRKDVYALPYNGEEVKLHWANRDQYYIKSAQVLESFEWKCGEQRVRFKLRDADTATDNNKEERKFVLALDDDENALVSFEGDVLTIEFDFKKDSRKRDALNADAEARLKALAENVTSSQNTHSGTGEVSLSSGPALTAAIAVILAPFNDKKSHFLHRLNGWTARGSFDFFIHKNLRDFLARELDFYLKNEVVKLDNLFAGQAGVWEKTTLAKARAMHVLGGKIIEFLSSLEELQLRLWEKQKWVTQSRAVIPFALVPAEMQSEVLNNSAQIAEWQALYGVEDEAVSTVNPIAWASPPSLDWAGNHADIAVDTQYFDAAWTRRLWSELSKHHTLDELWNGVLWNGDNFAALNLMKKRFAEAIKCVYIDPPYNTGSDGFLYKDAYQHSSWLSMMQDRLEKARELMSDDGVIFVSIDEREAARLRLLTKEILGDDNFVTQITWRRTKNKSNQTKHFANVIDYILVCSKMKGALRVNRMSSENTGYNFADEKDSYSRNTLLDKKRGSHNFEVLSPKKQILKGPWVVKEEEFQRLRGLDLIHWSNGKNETPYKKAYLGDTGGLSVPDNFWDSKIYGSNQDGSVEIENLFGVSLAFNFPKPSKLMNHLLGIGLDPTEEEIVLDYFAGSGTTGHALINLQRADVENENRRFILVEMGQHFDSVLVPRLKKAAYADKWRDGRPTDASHRQPISQSLWVYRLESYEDALEHLAATIQDGEQLQLEAPNDDFTVRYALSLDTKNGTLPLSNDLFMAPFAIQMRVGGESIAQSQSVTVDAVATLNWLLGLRVHKMWFPSDELAAVCGLTPDDKPVAVVWRHLKGVSFEAADAALLEWWKNDAILNNWRQSQGLHAVYLNGDSTLGTQKQRDEAWEIVSLEHTFRELMFASVKRSSEAF